MSPRILLVGFSERHKYFGQMFYATFQMIRNGFIRAGASAFLFSDRDTADFAAPFAIRRIGKIAANRRLMDFADEIEPHLIVLMHADLIDDAAIHAIRQRHPETRVMSYFIDPIVDDFQRARFSRFAALSDVSFATTAGPTLSSLNHAGNVGFMPNPVDFSVFHAEAHAAAGHDHDFFFAGKPKGREQLLNELAALLPHRNCGFHLRVNRGSKLAIGGANYLRALGASKVTINATVGQSPYLYSSDRIAQYFSAGCLVAQPQGPELEDLYGADTMLTFRDAGDLADRVENMLADGSWREIARHGQAMAHQVSDCRVVSQYMMDRSFARQTFEWPQWTREFYEKA